MAEARKKIPICPMLSSGTGDNKVCLQEHCAWYMASAKSCAIYISGHYNILKIKEKQQGKH